MADKPIASKTNLISDSRGSTSLEWTLLVVVIVIPSYLLIVTGIDLLVAHYQMMVAINALPLP